MSYFSLITCPLCQSENYQIVYQSTLQPEHFLYKKLVTNLKNTSNDLSKHAQIVKCKQCSLVYVNPLEDLSLLLRAYGEVVDDEYLETEQYRKILLRQHLQRVSRFRNNGKLLDVGSFAGFYLDLAKNQGWQTYGIEPSKWARAIAEKKGIKHIGKDFLTAKIEKSYFDAITLWDVIEHLPQPHKVFTKLYKSLKPGGILAIGTPNIESIFAKLLGKNCPFLIRMHIILYSPQTLHAFLEQHSFKIVDISYYGRTFPVSYMLDRLQSKHILFTHVRTAGKTMPYLLNTPITLNFRDSMRIIAMKI